MAVYLIANFDIVDPDGYREYQKVAGPIVAGGKVIALDPASVIKEGEPGAQTVVIEYPDKETALAAYESEDYQAVIGMRLAATTNGSAVIVDGIG
ncbi:MAG: DUF1330 domain-containing protein [Actinomycetota bacterium]